MNPITPETISYAAMGIAGWAALQVIKVPSLEEKVDHLVERVDAIFDHLLADGSDSGRGGPDQTL